jgi:hypothetical protein
MISFPSGLILHGGKIMIQIVAPPILAVRRENDAFIDKDIHFALSV